MFCYASLQCVYNVLHQAQKTMRKLVKGAGYRKLIKYLCFVVLYIFSC